jgi:DNA-binding XRE family transcriptional regulator
MDCLPYGKRAAVLRSPYPLTCGSYKTTIYTMRTKLKEWREKRGLSLRELGERSGVHYVSIVKMEAGKLDPQLSTLLKLCRALEINLHQLVGKP